MTSLCAYRYKAASTFSTCNRCLCVHDTSSEQEKKYDCGIRVYKEDDAHGRVLLTEVS